MDSDFERQVLRFIGAAEERLDQIKSDLDRIRVDIQARQTVAACNERHAGRLKLPTSIQGWLAIVAAILALFAAFRVEVRSREELSEAAAIAAGIEIGADEQGPTAITSGGQQ